MEMWKFGIIIFVIQSSNAIVGKSTNILFSDKVTFIDHEFMMFNYQPFEIGDHFTEYVGLYPFSKYC
jgi:hypothetical protein